VWGEGSEEVINVAEKWYCFLELLSLIDVQSNVQTFAFCSCVSL
jgi:hypothetical protein